MKDLLRIGILTLVAAGAVLVLGTGQRTAADEVLYESRCRACHLDDSPTCVGCHRHRGVLSAAADQATYLPGHPVTVTLSGGAAGGWLRALLYDHNGLEVARVSGPSGSGDDGLGDPVQYPVQLHASAPMAEGDYTWNAAWYGSNDLGTTHLERLVPVAIHVFIDTAVDESWPAELAGTEMYLGGSPNPAATHCTLRLAVGPDVSAAELAVFDASGRHVRKLGQAIQGPARRDVAWDGRDDAGVPLAAGTYFAILSSGATSVAHPLILLR